MAEKRKRRNKEKLASSSESNSNDSVNESSSDSLNDSLHYSTICRDRRVKRDLDLTFLKDPQTDDDDYPLEQALHAELLGVRY